MDKRSANKEPADAAAGTPNEAAAEAESTRGIHRKVGDLLLGALVVVSAFAIGLALAMPVLRQARLLEQARQVCAERETDAKSWLVREERVEQALKKEWVVAQSRKARLWAQGDEEVIQNGLRSLAGAASFRVLGLDFGMPQLGEAFAAIPATLRVQGDSADLPPFLKSFYTQDRLVRLVALDLEAPSFGSQDVVATLRWEYPASTRRRLEAEDPTTRWSPPVVATRANRASVSRWNRKRWDKLSAAARSLRALSTDLRRVARMEAERKAMERERRSLGRWESATRAEARAILRKVAPLLRRMEVSAMGKASLRPGPAGALRIVDDD